MGCELYEPHLTAYLDNELTDEARSMMEWHVSACENCRQTLAELKATRAVMKQWKPAEVGEEFVDRMRERVSREQREGEERKTRIATPVRAPRQSRTTVTVSTITTAQAGRRWSKTALAASVLVAAGLGLAAVLHMGMPTTGERPMSVAAARKMVNATNDVAKLSEVAVATDSLVTAQVRKDRPRVAGVIGTETVQLFLETARYPAQGQFIRILMGTGAETTLTAEAPGTLETLTQEAKLWLSADLMASAYGQDAPPEMTARTQAALGDGLKLERTGKYEEAIESYGAVKAGSHERAVALVRRAGLLIKLGRFREAGEALTEASTIGLEAGLTKDVATRLQRRVEIAREAAPRVETLKAELAAKPENARGWRELADLQLGSGNYAGASAALAGLAGQLNGDARAMARFRAAWCDKNAGEYEKALKAMEQLRGEEGVPKDVRMMCMFESADILYRCGRLAQSIDEHKILIGYPAELDDASRALLILRVGYVQMYDLSDAGAARETLKKLTDARYSGTPAGKVAAMMLGAL